MDERLAIVDPEPTHLDEIVALLEAQLREHDIATDAGALCSVASEVIADPRHGFILLATVDDAVAGLAYAAAHLSAEHGGPVGWLEELYVAPRWRERGIGSDLLRAVISRAQRLGWRALELEVVAGHERVAGLYVRHGFAALARARFTLELGGGDTR